MKIGTDGLFTENGEQMPAKVVGFHEAVAGSDAVEADEDKGIAATAAVPGLPPRVDLVVFTAEAGRPVQHRFAVPVDEKKGYTEGTFQKA